MKVDKYDVNAKSGARIWVLVEHSEDINSLALPDGYSIKEFVKTFEFTSASEPTLNYDVAIDCITKKGCYYGTTTMTGCQIKG
ncbi:hypothetical protein JHD46_08020 [Sulfurimonas sp. SAG-AH-194-C20]|nr:hypothetical protein [Sulfurimonas sp. SAG-AH-194-C20]MDF1879580.1 hypothetical protein [Sulfurimonas sp. SAG-AH-194-C20]